MNILFPKNFEIEKVVDLKADVPFSNKVISLLSKLSAKLLANPSAKQYPDVITFAFYCRKANLLKLKQISLKDGETRLGKGILFHIAPSNVPVNFAYSLIAGLLSGNINIVRLPTKSFDQVNIIISELQDIYNSSEYKDLLNRIVLIKYERGGQETEYLSSIANMRVIWGGDDTIADIRKSQLPPRSTEITFADRYSICIINAKKYLSDANYPKVANDFYNDTMLMDQNACTSPHLVIWKGEKVSVNKAKDLFWSELHKIVKQKYDLQPIMAVDKLNSLYTQAVSYGDINKQESEDNLIWRVDIDKLNSNIDEFRCNSGYFAEYTSEDINEIASLINEKYQTLAYYGFDLSELESFVLNNRIKGIDRIVPIGRTLDFSLTWDGYDLINVFSRNCELL
jgi:hypothetical protein